MPADRPDWESCRYRLQDSAQTLREGLDEYYARNCGRVLPPESLPQDCAVLFRNHDICHVIFGLDTTVADEAMADARTLLSCDVGWRRYAQYLARNAEVQAIFKEAGYVAILWAALAVDAARCIHGASLGRTAQRLSIADYLRAQEPILSAGFLSWFPLLQRPTRGALSD